MCDEAVDDCLAALKLISGWFVTSKMINKLSIALYEDENILYVNENPRNVAFSYNEMVNFVILMKMILILLFSSDFWVGI